MSKQDRQGVRSASDLERKYDFSQIAEFSKANKNQNAAISQLTQTLAQFMADTNGKLSQLDDDLQFIEGIEDSVTELQTTVIANSNSISELQNNKADVSGWDAQKYIGTDEEGNLIATEKPTYTASDIETEDGETVEDKLNSVLSKAYPVGAIYITISNASPVDLFGGEWELIAQGNLLVGLPQENEEDLPELQQTVDTCYLWKRTA